MHLHFNRCCGRGGRGGVQFEPWAFIQVKILIQRPLVSLGLVLEEFGIKITPLRTILVLLFSIEATEDD